MKRIPDMSHRLAAGIMATTLWAIPGLVTAQQPQPEYTHTFMLDKCKGFSSNGTNPYFILKPGYRLIFSGKEDGVNIGLTITVLNKTMLVNGIKTRVVQEVETKGGKLVEISENYFAICKRDNSVVYFGEAVDIYENGVIVSHDGSWRAGVNNARPGLIMPGTVLLGARYFQEIAPGVALDRAEILSLSQIVATPARLFRMCLKTIESTPLEPGSTGFKFYAPGIGLVQDGPFKLVAIQNHDDDDDDDD